MIKPWLFVLICCGFCSSTHASKLSISYEKPESGKYSEIYSTLKSNHGSIYGESAKYLKRTYNWPEKIEIIVTTCGYVNSRYIPDDRLIVICYESLYQKVYDYPERAKSKEVFEKRVFQNVMFTFWHEMGHALIDQFSLNAGRDIEGIEWMADEFATLSMLWRKEEYWKDIVMMSALHFKSKSQKEPERSYNSHASDELRYQKMIALLYGFAQKSYSKLDSEVNQITWLDQSAQEYYLERSSLWEKYLRNHCRQDFFIN